MKKAFIPIPPMAEQPPTEEIDVKAVLDSYLRGDIDLICILGPTASGKTGYAVSLARDINSLLSAGSFDRTGHLQDRNGCTEGDCTKNGAEIISADSRQVYSGMDIGTGKDIEEYGEIPVHLIDIVPAGSKYNIYNYQKDFEKVYSDIRSRGAVPILCGGSGLYIEAVTMAYSLPDVPANPQLRAELEKEDFQTLTDCLAALKPLHNTTDCDTKQRLIRALEIALWQKEHPVERTAFLPKNTYYIGTSVSRDERNARIDRRLDRRLAEGMIEEVRGLLDSGISPEDLIYYGLEYKFITLYITGQLTFEQMRAKLAIAIHQFAKRQMTWFRGMERKGTVIHWTKV